MRYVLTEAEVGNVMTVEASYTDGHGTDEAVSSGATAAVANVNDAPTGPVTIDNATPARATAHCGQHRRCRTAWAPSPTPGRPMAWWSAAARPISLTEAEVGKVMTVEASYTDGHGTAKS